MKVAELEPVYVEDLGPNAWILVPLLVADAAFAAWEPLFGSLPERQPALDDVKRWFALMDAVLELDMDEPISAVAALVVEVEEFRAFVRWRIAQARRGLRAAHDLHSQDLGAPTAALLPLLPNEQFVVLMREELQLAWVRTIELGALAPVREREGRAPKRSRS